MLQARRELPLTLPGRGARAMTIRSLRSVARVLSPLPPPIVPIFRALRLGAIKSGIDVEDGGDFKIVGTTKIAGTPAQPTGVRVVLHDQISGRLVRSQWSDALTGGYAFLNIRLGAFYTVAFDHTGAYRAVIADNQTPEPM